MKAKLLNRYTWLLVFLFLTANLFAQPTGFNYQAIARGSDMKVLDETILTLHFSIRDASGQLVWQEKHFAETNAMGLFSLHLCENADHRTGGSAQVPEEIDWGGATHTLTVEFEEGGELTSLGTHLLMAVPYAIYAADGPDADPQNEIQDLQINGNLLSISGHPEPTTIDLGAISSGEEKWQKTGDHLVYMDGNVGIGFDNPYTRLAVNGPAHMKGVQLPNNFGPNPDYVGSEGNYIAFGHQGVSEDFIGYRDNTFYLKDSPDGGDVSDPNLVVGGKLAVGTDQFTGAGLAVNGSIDLASEDPLFEVKRKDGNTVFAVYNDGVRVFVDEDSQSKMGGFAVGGYNAENTTAGNEYLRVSPDSVRIYINDDLAKASKGGFAVGGYKKAKGFSREFLRVTDDSTRVYVDDDLSKGIKGGFAVGGYKSAKATVNDFLSLTPDNYFIGHAAGSAIRTGLYNSFIGYQSGENTTTGSNNIFLGYNSGRANTAGNNNIFVGNASGYHNADGDYNTYIGFETGYYGGNGTADPSFNTYMGYQAGRNNRSGAYNTFIGYRAGLSGINASGEKNVFVGESAGLDNITGSNNIFLGNDAGRDNVKGKSNVIIGTSAGARNNGDYNVFIGYESGFNNINGADDRYSKWNTFIGYKSGHENTYGWHNIAIGYEAGYSNKTATNLMMIGNSAGYSITDGYGSTFIGHLCAQDVTFGQHNTYVGYFAAANSTTGSNNTYMGYAAAAENSGSDNVMIGTRAGHDATSSDNVIVGNSAGYRVTGNGNTIIGQTAGYNATGGGNVFIGNQVGYNETGSNLLYIDNSSTSAPLIYGNFSSNYVRVNNKLGVGVNPSTNFAVAGLTGTTGGLTVRWSGNNFYYYSSSRDTKEDIHPLQEDFYKILSAQPVSFIDKATGEPHIGYIAEEFVDKGLDKLVVYMDGKPSALSYELITVYNLEIIKDQQKKLEQKDAEIEDLKERLDRIESALGL